MAGYFSVDRQLVLGNQSNRGDKMVDKFDGKEPKTEMKGAKKGMLDRDKKDGSKKDGKKSSRKSSRK
jgi:hypothetical protein